MRSIKIVTWNCNGALRKKLDALKVLNADIYIIQECEDPSKSMDAVYQEWAQYSCWIGDRKDRGLAIISKNDIGLQTLDWPSNGYKLFLPCSTSLGFHILGVWTKSSSVRSKAYIGQLWNYLNFNEAALTSMPIMIAGDFNSNALWDQRYPKGNHSDVVAFLNKRGLESVYHQETQEEQGKETLDTFFMYRKEDQRYHLDYAFVPRELTVISKTFEVGNKKQWLSLSDHLPLSFTLKINDTKA